jgi:hypothetical protein
MCLDVRIGFLFFVVLLKAKFPYKCRILVSSSFCFNDMCWHNPDEIVLRILEGFTLAFFHLEDCDRRIRFMQKVDQLFVIYSRPVVVRFCSRCCCSCSLRMCLTVPPTASPAAIRTRFFTTNSPSMVRSRGFPP